MSSGNAHDASEDEDDIKVPLDGTDTSKAEAALKAKLSRKRTKTGCLTCRKRRIKCGEERPVCKNCIKSKRHCEGYSQRVIFRPPTFEYRAAPNGAAHITFQAGNMAAPMIPVHPGQTPQYMVDPNAYPDIMPQLDQHFMPYLQQFQPVPGQFMPQQPMQFHQGYPMHPQTVPIQQAMPVSENYNMLQGGRHQQAPPPYQVPSTAARIQPMVTNVQPFQTPQYQTPAQTVPAYNFNQSGQAPHAASVNQESTWPDSSAAPANMTPTTQVSPTSTVPVPKYEPNQTPIPHAASNSWATPTYTPRPELTRPIDYQPPAPSSQGHRNSSFTMPPSATPSSTHVPHQMSDPATPDLYEYQTQYQGSQTQTQWLNDAAVEIVDDDYYDVDSDEDMDIDKPAVQMQDFKRQRTLNKALMGQHFNAHNMQIRRYDTFLEEGMLERYRVEWHANPLRNAATARVFAHFISATGPSLSVFERHPVNSSVLFTEGSVPFSQQGLWTYTMPMAALHHQGLLHAMLALSSLHIARLQGASITPSMQHYAWALKRIHSCVASQNPKKRLQVTTIAASMLLGFYEIMTADHMKWNMHLAGAKQLFVETDFAGMTRQYRQLKREKAAHDQIQRRRNSFSAYLNREEDFEDHFNDVDEQLISTLVGREVRYEAQGYVEAAEARLPPKLDLSNFEILKDLFWWYCKQDAYQSIVSGNPLL